MECFCKWTVNAPIRPKSSHVCRVYHPDDINVAAVLVTTILLHYLVYSTVPPSRLNSLAVSGNWPRGRTTVTLIENASTTEECQIGDGEDTDRRRSDTYIVTVDAQTKRRNH